MSSLPSRLVCTAVLTLAAAATAHGQKLWVAAQPPCEVPTGHRFVNGAILQLKQAVEASDSGRRESKLLEARNLLIESLVTADQGDNPGAWYYLGRYYAEAQDAAGADSAFAKALDLAPECGQDISQYRTPLSAVAMNDAAMAWQTGHTDSAATLFRLAHSLDAENANALLFLSSMYASGGQLDSAEKYVALGSDAAGDRPTFRNRRKRALLDVARGYADLAAKEPALGRAAPARITRDSLQRVITRDSTTLANLIAEWSGQRLRPEVQQRVQRDSTRVAQRLAQARSRRASALQAAAEDSAAAERVLEPAIRAYTNYVQAFPEDHSAHAKLIQSYAIIGHLDQTRTAIDGLTAAEGVETRVLLQTGLDLLNGGHAEGSAYIMEAALERNPFSRDALFVQAQALYRLRRAKPQMDAAQRLAALDPLNQQTMRMMAGAWELAGKRDSANKYVRLANAGMGWTVTVAQFLPTETSVVLNGTVGNITNAARPAVTLVFEFLEPNGAVSGSATVDAPALQPGELYQIALAVEVVGAVGWRYRKQ